jgi:hypothetical protein
MFVTLASVALSSLNFLLPGSAAAVDVSKFQDAETLAPPGAISPIPGTPGGPGSPSSPSTPSIPGGPCAPGYPCGPCAPVVPVLIFSVPSAL